MTEVNFLEVFFCLFVFRLLQYELCILAGSHILSPCLMFNLRLFFFLRFYFFFKVAFSVFLYNNGVYFGLYVMFKEYKGKNNNRALSSLQISYSTRVPSMCQL